MADLAESASPLVRAIYRRMKELELNPTSLAARAGRNATYFRDMFNGKSQGPVQRFLPEIAKALECNVLDLLDPGSAKDYPASNGTFYEADEIALLTFWRILSKDGKRRVMEAVIQEADRIRGGGQ